MEKKQLQTDDKLLFVQHLNEYCSRLTNAQVRDQFIERQQVAPKTFINKMCGIRPFKGEEIAIVEKLYRQVLGDDIFEEQLAIFIANQTNGDGRTIDAAQEKAIKELAAVNDDLVTSKLLV